VVCGSCLTHLHCLPFHFSGHHRHFNCSRSHRGTFLFFSFFLSSCSCSSSILLSFFFSHPLLSHPHPPSFFLLFFSFSLFLFFSFSLFSFSLFSSSLPLFLSSSLPLFLFLYLLLSLFQKSDIYVEQFDKLYQSVLDMAADFGYSSTDIDDAVPSLNISAIAISLVGSLVGFLRAAFFVFLFTVSMLLTYVSFPSVLPFPFSTSFLPSFLPSFPFS
jgi:hypothetical protein